MKKRVQDRIRELIEKDRVDELSTVVQEYVLDEFSNTELFIDFRKARNKGGAKIQMVMRPFG